MATNKKEYRLEELVEATARWADYLMVGMKREYSTGPILNAMHPSLRRRRR